MPSFASALPLRGDERGYKLVTMGEDGEEYEYELGKELGRGGMGLVREAVRRRRRTCDKGKGKEREGDDESAVQSDCDADVDAEIEDDAIKVAVKIIPRHRHASLPFLQGMGAGAPAGNGIPGSTLPQGLVHHLHPSPLPSPATTRGPRDGSNDSPMRTDSYLSHTSSSDAPLSFRRPSRDRAIAHERARSTSSPIRPGMIARGLTLTAVEASPLPSPSLHDGADGHDAAMMGTSAPEREDGFFNSHGGKHGQSDAANGHPPGVDLQNPSDLLDLLLQRELSLWRQLSNLPSSSTAYAAEHPTRWTGKGGHPHIVALIGTHRTDEFDYVFMPLAEGGTLLEYLNNPAARRDPSPAGRTASNSGSRAASRGRAQKPRPRGSIPIAGSLSPPGGLAAQSGSKGLPLDEAGETFAQIVEAVRWMHEEAGVAHRDLKLENVVGCWSTDSGPAADFEAPMPASREGGRGRSRSRRRGLQMDDDGPPQMMRIKRKRKRVWKLADFGLAEVIPPQGDSMSSPTSPVHDVQPLAALARAGSLSRPTGERGGGGGLGSSVGPGAGGGQSSSAFLPHPHRNPPTAASQHHASPTAASTAHPTHNSPLSALLHPVGSLPYSSPEALRSPVPIVHPSTDIWALGCVLYALVAGRLPIWEEWELRLRVKLVKGEWDVPDELDPNKATSEEDRHERELALEVLKGCLEKDAEKRWTIRQVWESRWLAHIREREVKEREQRRRNNMAHLRLQVPPSPSALSTTSSLAPTPSPTSPTATRASSRGRPATRSSSSHPGSHFGPYPPPAPSSGASHTPAAGSTPTGGRSSRSRNRLPTHTRSTSRSSAYAHQYGAAGSEGGEQERRERGRSERRLRWDEERSLPYAGGGRRSLSQASSSTSASYGEATGETSGTSTPGGPGTPAEGGHVQGAAGHPTRGGRRHDWDDQERLETVGEPY